MFSERFSIIFRKFLKKKLELFTYFYESYDYQHILTYELSLLIKFVCVCFSQKYEMNTRI